MIGAEWSLGRRLVEEPLVNFSTELTKNSNILETKPLDVFLWCNLAGYQKWNEIRNVSYQKTFITSFRLLTTEQFSSDWKTKNNSEREAVDSFLKLQILGTLRSNDGVGNENVKKAKGSINKNYNFLHASRFFVHFFTITARLRRENV